MGGLPPVAPAVGTSSRVRLGRDYYVRIAGNDYSADPAVIGRLVDVHAGLTAVAVTCAGTVVAAHQRCWAAHQRCWAARQAITDPAHVTTAAALRTACQARAVAARGPAAAAGAVVGLRALSDYDDIFALTPVPAPAPAAAGLQAAR